MNTKNTNANGKIKLPVEFQVDVSLTESNISGKIFNGDLEIPIYIKSVSYTHLTLPTKA